MFEFLKSLLKSGKYFLFTDVLDRTVSFIVFLIFAKSITTALYGQVVTLFALTSIFSVLFDFGLPIFIQKESAKHNELSKIYSEIILLKIIFSAIYLFVCSFAFYLFISSIDIKLFLIILVITLLVSFGNTFKFFFYGRDNSRLVFKVSITSKLLLLVIVYIVFLYSRDVYLFLCGYLFSNIFLFSFLLIKLKIYKINYKKFDAGYRVFKDTFLLILPLGLATIFNILYDRIDILLLKYFLDFNKVAQYNVAYTIFKLSIIPFSTIIYPAFNRLSRESTNVKVLFLLLKKLVFTIIIFSLILVVMNYSIIPKLIPRIIGPNYFEASLLVPILSIAVIFIGLNNLTGVFLNSVNKFKAVMLATLAGLIINILLNIILIPKINSMGAVYSTILTEFSILIIEAVFVFKFFHENKIAAVKG